MLVTVFIYIIPHCCGVRGNKTISDVLYWKIIRFKVVTTLCKQSINDYFPITAHPIMCYFLHNVVLSARYLPYCKKTKQNKNI